MRCFVAIFVVAVMIVAQSTFAGGFDSGSDGSDGALSIFSSVEIDLSLAATGEWDMPSPVAGDGVYDPQRWAVVFKYASVDIVPGATVTFKNHPSGAPVVWLVQGDVFLGGTIDVSGNNGTPTGGLPLQYARPGPGGFQGGTAGVTGHIRSGGFGPGGGGPSGNSWGGGSHATAGAGSTGAVYAAADSRLLIGGSGGTSQGFSSGSYPSGGAGGGAIVIASSGTSMLNGTIAANGGNSSGGDSGGGSGGFIHLLANTITGSLTDLSARGGAAYHAGGDGRVRIEALTFTATGESDPPHTFGAPQPIFDPAPPMLRVTMAGGQSVPDDPRAGVDTADICYVGTSTTLNIVANNIPEGTTVTVYIKPAHGLASTVQTPGLAGDFFESTTSVVVSLPGDEPVEIQLRANWCE